MMIPWVFTNRWRPVRRRKNSNHQELTPRPGRKIRAVENPKDGVELFPVFWDAEVDTWLMNHYLMPVIQKNDGLMIGR